VIFANANAVEFLKEALHAYLKFMSTQICQGSCG